MQAGERILGYISKVAIGKIRVSAFSQLKMILSHERISYQWLGKLCHECTMVQEIENIFRFPLRLSKIIYTIATIL